MQQQLNKSYIQRIVSPAASPVWIINAKDATFYSINSNSEKEFLYSEEELIGKNILEICPSFNKNEFNTITGSEKPKTILTKIRRKDGKEQIAKLRISRFAVDEKYYFYVIVDPLVLSHGKHEITELTDSFYSYSFKTNLVPIIIVDKNSLNILQVNDSAIRLYGFSRDEFLNMKITNLHHPTHLDNAIKIFTGISEKRYNKFEAKHISNNDRIIEVEMFIQPVKWAEGNILMVIIHDISEKKLALRLLEENLNNYKLIANNSADLIIRHTPDGKINYASQASNKLLGYRPGFLILNNIYDFIHPEDADKTRKSFLVTSEASSKMRFRIKNFGGKYMWFECSSKVLSDYDLSGEKEIISILRDITELVEVENKLSEANERAGAVEKLKQIILANISHEMRTPLQSILGYSMLLKDKADNTGILEELNGIYENGQRLLRTINLFLNLSYLESNNFIPRFESYNLSDIVIAAAEPFNKIADEKGISLTVVPSDQEIFAKTDKILLKDTLDNLIDNAIKFTNRGGVEIKLSEERNTTKDYAVINISDSGIGIPTEKEKVALEEFRQISEGLSRNFQGIGLGLSISQKMIEKLNGKLKIESTEGKGTTVKIYLAEKD